ncbi:MAG: hypothetical protein K8J31_25210, partial [Anaerolineae bacterium]|nr:hypothetical protein [Anaerolineae bacterium]
MRKALLGWCLLLLIVGVAQAQDVPPPAQVFLERGQPDRLQFVDGLTGETRTVEVNGERYTLFGRGVMFYDSSANRV